MLKPGPKVWKELFGAHVESPLLSRRILGLLKQRCPFSSGADVLVMDTHILFLLPKRVQCVDDGDGEVELTLRHVWNVLSPRLSQRVSDGGVYLHQGSQTDKTDVLRQRFASESPDRSVWILMPKIRLEESFGKSFAGVQEWLTPINLDMEERINATIEEERGHFSSAASKSCFGGNTEKGLWGYKLPTTLQLTVAYLLSGNPSKWDIVNGIAPGHYTLWWLWTCDRPDDMASYIDKQSWEWREAFQREAPLFRATSGFYDLPQGTDSGGVSFCFMQEQNYWEDCGLGLVMPCPR